jgi:hypothetical protein
MDILKKFEFIDYHRYVDGILIIDTTHTTNINNTLDKFSRILPRIKFTIEEEFDKKLTS